MKRADRVRGCRAVRAVPASPTHTVCVISQGPPPALSIPALLPVAETESDLRERLAATRDAVLRDRLHFLIPAATGAVASLTQAADRLLRHRNTGVNPDLGQEA